MEGMIRLGKRNRLEVLREVDFGMYLDAGEVGDVLLPKRYIPEGTKVGDIVDVFLYLDSEERLVATTEYPLVEVNEFAYLEVKWTNEYGAFLDWGLMKDTLFIVISTVSPIASSLLQNWRSSCRRSVPLISRVTPLRQLSSRKPTSV